MYAIVITCRFIFYQLYMILIGFQQMKHSKKSSRKKILSIKSPVF